jgi:hypothetical protein
MQKSPKCRCNAKEESKFALHCTTVTEKFAFSHHIRIALPSLQTALTCLGLCGLVGELLGFEPGD